MSAADYQPSLEEILEEIRSKRAKQQAEMAAPQEGDSSLSFYIRYGKSADEPKREAPAAFVTTDPEPMLHPDFAELPEKEREEAVLVAEGTTAEEAEEAAVLEAMEEPAAEAEDAIAENEAEALEEPAEVQKDTFDTEEDVKTYEPAAENLREEKVKQFVLEMQETAPEEAEESPVQARMQAGGAEQPPLEEIPLPDEFGGEEMTFSAAGLEEKEDTSPSYQPHPVFEKPAVAVDDDPTVSYDGAGEERTRVIGDAEELQREMPPIAKERAEKMRIYFSLDGNERNVEENEPEVEYKSPLDEETCRANLSKRVGSTSLKLAAILVFAIPALYLSLAPHVGLPLPGFLDPATQLHSYLVALLILGVAAGFAAIRELAGGFASLFTFSASTSSLISAGYLLSVAQLAAACFEEKGAGDLPLLMPVSLLSLVFLILAQLIFRVNRRRSFRLVSSKLDKTAVGIIEDGSVQQHMTRLSSYENTVSSVGIPCDFLTDFFALSRQQDPLGRMQKYLSPVVLIISLILGVVAAVADMGLVAAFTLAAGVPVLAAPITASLASASLVGRMGKHLFDKGAMVSGFETITAIADTNGVIVDAVDLFPVGTVTLHGVKTFENHRIDEALLTIASVVHAAKSTYSNMFMEVIEGRTDILLPVDSYLYEDGMGISAWISNRRVLVGNRTLLINHNVEVPSHDYEARYLKADRELMYLSVGGEVAAIFILCYSPSNEVRMGLEKLHRAGFDIFVKTCDANTTPESIARIYDIDASMLSMLPGSSYKELEEMTAHCEKHPATLAFTGAFPAFSSAVYGCAKTAASLRLANVLQWISLILSVVAFLFLFFTASSLFNSVVLLAISLFFGLLVWLLPFMSSDR